jgi:hypothetical protein
MMSSKSGGGKVVAVDGPLTEVEMGEADAIGRRLRGELLGALERDGRLERSAISLARELGLDRNVCQRVIAGLDSRLDGVGALAKFPGAEGLALFARALIEHAGRSVKRSALLAAVESYEQFVRRTGGSQTRLLRRIQLRATERDRGVSKDNLATRKKLFEVATELQGYSVDAMIAIAGLRPMPESPEFAEGFHVMGLLGTRAYTAPMNLVTQSFTVRDRAAAIASEIKHEPLAGAPVAGLNLIEEFCTAPLPSSIFDSMDGRTRTIVEPGEDGAGPVNIVTGSRWQPDVHPALQPDPRWSNALGVHRPVRRMVQDVYLHRSLASMCVPAVASYLWHPGLTGNPAKHWNSALPGKYTLQMLGAGIANSATDAWEDHRRLTARVFELLGWDPAEMVGYRCEVEYPTWASVFYMMFDFGGAQKPLPAT